MECTLYTFRKHWFLLDGFNVQITCLRKVKTTKKSEGSKKKVYGEDFFPSFQDSTRRRPLVDMVVKACCSYFESSTNFYRFNFWWINHGSTKGFWADSEKLKQTWLVHYKPLGLYSVLQPSCFLIVVKCFWVLYILFHSSVIFRGLYLIWTGVWDLGWALW